MAWHPQDHIVESIMGVETIAAPRGPMGFLSKLFGTKKDTETQAEEHAVIIHFLYGSTFLQHVYAMEDLLRIAIDDAGAGHYDSYEVAKDGSDGFFYMYGPDAETLYRAIEPVVTACSFMRGATVTLRFGSSKLRSPKRVIQLPS
jgi:hypothetical protein